jgi:hypothetical protein
LESSQNVLLFITGIFISENIMLPSSDVPPLFSNTYEAGLWVTIKLQYDWADKCKMNTCIDIGNNDSF